MCDNQGLFMWDWHSLRTQHLYVFNFKKSPKSFYKTICPISILNIYQHLCWQFKAETYTCNHRPDCGLSWTPVGKFMQSNAKFRFATVDGQFHLAKKLGWSTHVKSLWFVGYLQLTTSTGAGWSVHQKFVLTENRVFVCHSLGNVEVLTKIEEIQHLAWIISNEKAWSLYQHDMIGYFNWVF